MEIKDKKGQENAVADHLSRLEENNENLLLPINENFLDEKLFAFSILPWYADLVNYLVSGIVPTNLSYQQRKKLFWDAKHYLWEEPLLYRFCADRIIRRCIPQEDVKDILNHCHTLECG